VKKPSSSSELRDNSKASLQVKDQDLNKLYRICLDFPELNTALLFPQQTAFTTTEELLMALKGKKVVSLDISSAFFIIPINQKE